MHHDCNIADKMDEREALLRKALERAGMDSLKIFKIVTFTNPRIDVECKYHYIKICPSNYLPSFIERFTSNQWYSNEDICTMMEAVTEVKCPEEYQMSINMKLSITLDNFIIYKSVNGQCFFFQFHYSIFV